MFLPIHHMIDQLYYGKNIINHNDYHPIIMSYSLIIILLFITIILFIIIMLIIQ